MKIGILGSGNIGGTLGQKWAQAGHELVFGVRDVNSPKLETLMGRIQGNARASSVAEASDFGEVVIISTPWSAVPSMVETHGKLLAGKILLDATNNFGGPVISSLDTILRFVPTAKVYRAFNSLGWEIFANPFFGDTQADMFYCGPGSEAQQVVAKLIDDVGVRPVYVGDLAQAHLVDNLGALWVQLAFRQGMGRQFALKVVSR